MRKGTDFHDNDLIILPNQLVSQMIAGGTLPSQ